MKNHHLTNEKIVGDRVLLVDGDTKDIVSKNDAILIAQSRDMDLVQFGNGKQPVCKILDYGKLKYKEDKQSRKKPKPILRKEVRMGLMIDEHDFQTKTKKINELILKKHPVKIKIKLKRRERGLRQNALERLDSICEQFEKIASAGKIEQVGDGVSTVLTPTKN